MYKYIYINLHNGKTTYTRTYNLHLAPTYIWVWHDTYAQSCCEGMLLCFLAPIHSTMSTEATCSRSSEILVLDSQKETVKKKEKTKKMEMFTRVKEWVWIRVRFKQLWLTWETQKSIRSFPEQYRWVISLSLLSLFCKALCKGFRC